jgi:hypothetical protein
MEKRERSARVKKLYAELKVNTHSQRYLQLIELLEHLQHSVQESMVDTTDTNELVRQQGQALSLRNLRQNLVRIPIDRNKLTGDVQIHHR